jgi:DNA-binding MarR family transcriptional regulator
MAKESNNLQLASDLRTVVTRLFKKLRSKSTATTGMLSLTERSVIGLLDRQKQMLPSELAAAEKITTQSMSQVLNHLLELGFITRKPSVDDKRKVHIALSPEGQKLLNKARNERDEWLNKALQETCTESEINMLRKSLVPLTRLVDFE